MSLTNKTIASLFTFSFLMALPPIKDQRMMEFISARYGGDTLTVASMLSDEFIYEHTPYVGLGIESHYVDGAYIVTSIINDSLQTDLNIGDRIHEFNGRIVDSLGLVINGFAGEMQKIILTKPGDSTFSHIETPLAIYQYEQGKESFLESIMAYSEAWYDYDISFEKIFSRKNETVVHYKWEGSKAEFGPTYHFSAIEIIKLNKKRNQIERIISLWSEKQFRDQFK